MTAASKKVNLTLWPDDLLRSAWTPVANLLLRRAREVPLSNPELLTLIYLISFVRKESLTKFTVSEVELGRQLGRSDRQVRRSISALCRKQVLRIVGLRGRSNCYDLTPLFEKLRELPEHPEVAGVVPVAEDVVATPKPPPLAPAPAVHAIGAVAPGKAMPSTPAGPEVAPHDPVARFATPFHQRVLRCGWRILPTPVMQVFIGWSTSSQEAEDIVTERLADLESGRAFPVPEKWTKDEIAKCCPRFSHLVRERLRATGLVTAHTDDDFLRQASMECVNGRLVSDLHGKDQGSWQARLAECVALSVEYAAERPAADPAA